MPDGNKNQQNLNELNPQGNQLAEQSSSKPSFIDKDSSLVSNHDKKKQEEKDSSQKLAKTAAKGAAAYLGGPIGAKAVDELSKTKAGQQMLNKGGQALSRMPGMKRGAKILDKTGTIDKADKAIDMASGGKPDLSSGSKGADLAKANDSVPKKPSNNMGGESSNADSSSGLGKLNPFAKKKSAKAEEGADQEQKSKLSLPFIGHMSLTTKVIAVGSIIGVLLLFFLILALFGIKRFDPMFANDDVKYSATGYSENGKTGDESDKKGAYFVAEDEKVDELYEKINEVSEKYDSNSKTIRRGLAAIYTVIRDNEQYFPDDIDEEFEDNLKKMAKMINKNISDEVDTSDGKTPSDDDTTTTDSSDNDSNVSEASSGEDSTKRVIWVGDSRFNQMYALTHNNDWSKVDAVSNGYEDGNDFWVAKGSQSYSWFDNTAVDIVTKNLKSGDTIIINMGLNGITQANKYVERINKLVDGDWKDANVVYMSVNPVNDSRSNVKNKQVEEFNDTIKSNISSKVKYIDTYTALYSDISSDPDKTTSDGFHYPKEETNKKIYSLGRGSSGASRKTTDNGIDREWLIKQLKKFSPDLTDKQAEALADEVIQNIEDYKTIIDEEDEGVCDEYASSADQSTKKEARFTAYNGDVLGGSLGDYKQYVKEGTIKIKDGYAIFKGGTTSKLNKKKYGEPGKEYMIVATATEYLLGKNSWVRDENIKYFKYGDTFSISVSDNGGKTYKDYNAIVLDSCGGCMAWSLTAASKGMTKYAPKSARQKELCKRSEGYKIDLYMPLNPSDRGMGYIMDGTTGSTCSGQVDLGDLTPYPDGTKLLTGKSLKSVVGESGIKEVNNLITTNVEKYGKGTGKGTAAAAITLINYVKSKGYRLPYQWAGGHGCCYTGDSVKLHGALGIWGTETGVCKCDKTYPKDKWASLDCSGFVSWAIRNGGCGNFSVNNSSGFKTMGKHTDAKHAKPGDVYVKNGHVTLVVQNNGSDIILAESTSNPKGITFTSYNKSSYKNSGEYEFRDLSSFYSSKYCR